MIEKEITFVEGDTNSDVFTLISPETLEKTASAEYSKELQDFVSTLKSSTDRVYALINALSAGEFYGSNRNGDYFPEEALQKYHKTFEVLGRVYKHHMNKDPNKAMGKVVFAFYNPEMHRVELVVQLDAKRASQVISKMRSGHRVATSMGTKVPFDICSCCGNVAKTRAEYCDHLKHSMNKILPSGKRVYAINTRPKFFDISVVTIGADRTSSIITKLASLEQEEQKQDFNLETTAEMKKTITGKMESITADPKRLIVSGQKRLSADTIEKLSKYSMNEVLSTFLGLRIMPLRQDFQKLALYISGKKEMADELEKSGVCFEIEKSAVELEELKDVSLDNFNEKIAHILIPEVPGSSLTKPYIIARELEKIADIYKTPAQVRDRSLIRKLLFTQSEEPPQTAHKNPALPLGVLGTLYYGWSKHFNTQSVSGFRQFMHKNPWLLPIIMLTGTGTSLIAQDRLFKKTASKAESGNAVYKLLRNSLVTVPGSYYISADKEHKALRGERISGIENFMRKHPMVIGLLASAAGVKGESLVRAGAQKVKSLKNIFKKAEFVARLEDEHLNTIFEDLIIA